MASKRAQSKHFILFMITAFMLSWMAMTLSFPVIPYLGKYFKGETEELRMVTPLFFICYGLAELIWCRIGEIYNKRNTLILGLIIALIGNFIIILATHADLFMWGRVVEAFGIAVVAPVARSIICDVLEDVQRMRLLSRISIGVALVTPLAPIISGFVYFYFGWHAIFRAFIAILAFFILWTVLFLRERWMNRAHREILAKERAIEAEHGLEEMVDVKEAIRKGHKIWSWREYGELLSNRKFWSYVVCYSAYSGIMIAYYAAMPYWFVNQMGVPAQYYATLGIYTIGGYLVGLFYARKKLKTIDRHYWLRKSIGWGAVLGIIALAMPACRLNGLPWIIALTTAFAFIAGRVFPAAYVGVQRSFRDKSTAASALMLSILLLTVALFSWIMSDISVHSLWGIGLFLFLTSNITFVLNGKLYRH